MSRGLGFTGWHIGQLVFGRGHWQAFIAANPELREQWAGHDLDTGTDPLTAYYTAREANAGRPYLLCMIIYFTASF